MKVQCSEAVNVWCIAGLLFSACGVNPDRAQSSTTVGNPEFGSTEPVSPSARGGAGAQASPANTTVSATTMSAGTGMQMAPVTPTNLRNPMAGEPAAGAAGAMPMGGMMAMGAAGTSAMAATSTVATLYWLDINSNRVLRSQNFGEPETVVARTGTAPDGVAVDISAGKLYWTNMGSLLGTGGGTLQRANLDGTMIEEIVMRGVAQTPKQMQIDLANRHIYWSDREGAKVWRAGMDGGNPTAIVSGHGLRQCVGIALDVSGARIYFTDRMGQKCDSSG